MASGCPSHTPSAATRRRPPTSPTRTAAGTDRPGGGEPRQSAVEDGGRGDERRASIFLVMEGAGRQAGSV